MLNSDNYNVYRTLQMLSACLNIQFQLAENQARLGPKQADELTSGKLLV